MTLLGPIVVVVCGYLLLGFIRGVAARYRANPKLVRHHAFHFLMWGAAVLSLSGTLATYRRLDGERFNPHPVLNVFGGILDVLILLAACIAIGFFMYREDRRHGKVKRPIRLYEWALRSQAGSH